MLARNPIYPIHLLYAADRAEHILYRGEVEQWRSAHSEFRCETMTTTSDKLHAQLFDEIKRRWVDADGDRSRYFYVCGVGKGVLRIRDLLRGAGYERRAVHYEQW
jgi:ferredoxin-NADP reductase